MRKLHTAPRQVSHRPRTKHSRAVVCGYLASVVFIVILALVSWAFGQEQLFPFKTWEDLTTGTSAWVLLSTPPELRSCPGMETVLLTKYQFLGSAGAGWVIYTDGVLFAAAYFPPRDGLIPSTTPLTIVVGHIVDGQQVRVETVVPFTGEQRPCDQWRQKTTQPEH